MAIPLPPALMVLKFTRDGSSGELGAGSNTIEFKPDVGRGPSRARSTVIDDVFTLSTYMTEAQYDLFVEFYKRTLKAGLLPFDFFDPDSRSIRTFELLEKPSFTYPGAGYRYVSLKVLRYDQ
jgi:hypothetical protein